MKQLVFNEANLVSGGECLYRGMTDDGIDIYEDCHNQYKYNSRLGLGAGILMGGFGLMVTLFTSCCGSRYKALDRLESAIAGESCCFPRYASRLLFSGFCGALSTFGLSCVAIAGGALTLGLAGIYHSRICVPCTP